MRYDIEINKILEQFAMPVTGFSSGIREPKETFNVLYTVAQILDPSPLMSVPDLVSSIYNYQIDQNEDNLIDMLLSLVFLIPPTDYIKAYKLIKGVDRQQARREMINYIKSNKDRILNYIKSVKGNIYKDAEKAFNILSTATK